MAESKASAYSHTVVWRYVVIIAILVLFIGGLLTSIGIDLYGMGSSWQSVGLESIIAGVLALSIGGCLGSMAAYFRNAGKAERRA